MKDFVFNHAPNYPTLIVEFVGGDPRLVFFDKDDTELKTINLSDMDVPQIHNLLAKNDIKPKEATEQSSETPTQ